MPVLLPELPTLLCLQSRTLRNVYFGTTSIFSYIMFEHHASGL